MITRRLSKEIKKLYLKYPVITITGPRQSGKTLLVRSAFPEKEYVNLEDPQTRLIALEDPKGFLNRFKYGAILDEIQKVPDLLSYIQVLVDEKSNRKKFILTGSNQLKMLNSVSQSLAGRTAILKLFPFSLDEIENISTDDKNRLIYSGFYPRIYDKKLNPTQFLSDYFETYIQKDIRQLVNIKDLNLFTKFVKLCAGRTAQILNISSLASDTGISHTTAQNWLSFLEAGYIIFLLPPYYGNINKRFVKSPKLYFCDVGLASFLLGIRDIKEVQTHPLIGSLYETLVVGEILKYFINRNLKNEIYFLKDNSLLEMDVLIQAKNSFIAIEIKSAETFNKDFLRNFKIFSKYFKQTKSALIYAGKTLGEVNGINIINHFEISKFLDKAI